MRSAFLLRGARASRAGFTLVEVVMVLAVVSIVTRIALPNFQEAVMRARAAAAVGDVEVVRIAAHAYYARSNQWPSDSPAGVIPAGLEEDLPEGFTFDRGEYLLDWERWTIPGGLSAGSSSAPDSATAPASLEPKALLGISIATDDEMLGNAVAALMGPQGWYTLGHNATFLIEGM